MVVMVMIMVEVGVMITMRTVCECRAHGKLMEINGQLMEAFQLYHNLMVELPSYGYSTMSLPPSGFSGAMAAPPVAPSQMQPPSYMSLNQVSWLCDLKLYC